MNIKQFTHSALVIIIHDILEFDIIVPRLVFDYSTDPKIQNGYYMYQNVSGNTITLNMNLIEQLRNENDIKTVITYGIIHEIVHLYQGINSKYKTDKLFYTNIEDEADMITINFIRENINLINNKLNFEFNDVFLTGIERQLSNIKPQKSIYEFDKHEYICKVISGALINKLNYNFDYLYNQLYNNYMLTVVFPDKRNYYLDLYYSTTEELDLLINLIYLTNINMMHLGIHDYRLIIQLI